jgi:hypothetical protein
VEIEQMWSRWIHEGVFDDKSSSPDVLARLEMNKEGLAGGEDVYEDLRTHVRRNLRSGEKNKVVVAMDHIQAAANASAPILSKLLRKAESCRHRRMGRLAQARPGHSRMDETVM